MLPGRLWWIVPLKQLPDPQVQIMGTIVELPFQIRPMLSLLEFQIHFDVVHDRRESCECGALQFQKSQNVYVFNRFMHGL